MRGHLLLGVHGSRVCGAGHACAGPLRAHAHTLRHGAAGHLAAAHLAHHAHLRAVARPRTRLRALQQQQMYIQSTTDITRLITSIYYSHIAIANDIHWSIYELTADAPCPALTGEPWDVYFELHG